MTINLNTDHLQILVYKMRGNNHLLDKEGQPVKDKEQLQRCFTALMLECTKRLEFKVFPEEFKCIDRLVLDEFSPPTVWRKGTRDKPKLFL